MKKLIKLSLIFIVLFVSISFLPKDNTNRISYAFAQSEGEFQDISSRDKNLITIQNNILLNSGINNIVYARQLTNISCKIVDFFVAFSKEESINSLNRAISYHPNKGYYLYCFPLDYYIYTLRKIRI